MKFFSITDRGIIRQQNQDVCFASAEPIGALPNFFFVADGMGGEKAGQYASKTASSLIRGMLEMSSGKEPIKALKEAIEYANLTIYTEALESEEKKGMGTTFVSAFLKDSHMIVSNVGDSRLYVSAVNGLQQITKDHSFVDELVRYGKVTETEAKNHPKRHYITRAVGAEKKIEIDFFDVELDSSDRIILCSDGLTNMVSDEEIQRVLRSDAPIEEQAMYLVKMADDNGGNDNITVVIVEPEI
ncbi:MAG: Stp1/IreP family PP2C-type Ser/Thr phosphatase [Lachnospiraceae bacterium]|jgi:protein phosphatase|nr:Stp1/IreP family PP2C-type Ser/Thr phosphatase [Lachnospiraceae bacterium]